MNKLQILSTDEIEALLLSQEARIERNKKAIMASTCRNRFSRLQQNM
jgi:hypothetical protein